MVMMSLRWCSGNDSMMGGGATNQKVPLREQDGLRDGLGPDVAHPDVDIHLDGLETGPRAILDLPRDELLPEVDPHLVAPRISWDSGSSGWEDQARGCQLATLPGYRGDPPRGPVMTKRSS